MKRTSIPNPHASSHSSWIAKILPKKKKNPAEAESKVAVQQDTGEKRRFSLNRRFHLFGGSSSAEAKKKDDAPPRTEVTEDSMAETPAAVTSSSFSTANTQNLKDAEARLAKAFSREWLLTLKEESTRAIDFYLAKNRVTVTEKVRQLLILVDMSIRAVHHALPYGRGNVAVTADQSLATQAGRPPHGLDLDEMEAKAYLTYLGVENYQDAEEFSHPKGQRGPIESTLRLAANSVLMGSAACGGSSALLPALVMAHAAQLGLSENERLEIRRVHSPVIGVGAEPVNHVFCEVKYIDANGVSVVIVADPFSEMNTPVLKEHSKYNYQMLNSVTTPFTDPALPYEMKIADYMRDASTRLSETEHGTDFRATFGSYTDVFKTAKADNRDYSLTNPHQGLLVAREALNMVKEGVVLPRREGDESVTRRPSIESARLSPFIKRLIEKKSDPPVV